METVGHDGHRDITGGGFRAAVFGVSDGLLTNVALILGVAAAHPSNGYVTVAGLAGLIAGAFSMAIGEFISMGAQRAVLERELRVEALEIKERPEAERVELAQLYQDRGVPPELANEVARYLMRDPKVALEVHAREEMGVSSDSMGSPWQAAIASFTSFAAGAFIPLVAWFFVSGASAVLISIGLSLLATIAVGVVIAWMSGKSTLRTVIRQLVLYALAAGITYGIGRLIGGLIK